MMNYHIIVCSHIGNSRTMQEDNYLAGHQNMLSPTMRDSMCASQSFYCRETTLPIKDYCAFVCDGMGGHAHGEIASLTAVQLLKKNYDELIQAAAVSTEAIRDIISSLNDEFCRIASTSHELRTMGTTLCGVIVKKSRIYVVNVGDSRLYFYRNGTFKQITVDHTEGQRLQNLGFLTEDEVLRFPNRKAIYKHIGQRVNLRPDVFEIDGIIPGTELLLTTDGLTDALSDDEIHSILKSEKSDLKMCGSKLIKKALTRNLGFGDNITLMLLKL